MRKEKESIESSPDPILDINEFEEESVAILESAKKEASEIIEKANLEANGIIQKEKEEFARLEEEYLNRVEQEVKIEKKNLGLDVEDKLKKIQNMPNERIEKAARYILERLVSKVAVK